MKMEKLAKDLKNFGIQKIILALVALSLLLAIFYIVINDLGKEDIKSESKACLDLKSRVLTEIDKMNYCSTENDCVLINGCPNGCNNLVNKDAEWGALNELSFEFVDKCGECTEVCQGALRAGEIVCRDNKCVSTRSK